MKEPNLNHYPKSQTIQWIDLDTEEAFDKNVDSVMGKSIMDALGWTKESFSYQFDDIGFRNPPGILGSAHYLALGCSFTMGVGLSNTQTWPHILAEKLGVQVYNAGQGGAAGDTVFRVGRYMIPNYKPDGVFVLVPPKTRFEIVSNEFYNGIPTIFAPSEYTQEEFELLTRTLTGEWFQYVHDEKNRLALEQICNINGIPYVEITLNETPDFHYRFKVTDFISKSTKDFKGKLARDLEHPGTYWQDGVAKMMFERWENHALVRHLDDKP